MIKAVDVWPGLALLALGIYILFNALGWVVIGPDGPGPGLFPMVEGIVMILLSGVVVVTSLSRRSAGDRAITEWRSSGRVLATWVVFLVCALLLKLVGFVISFSLLTLFVVSVMYRRPILTGLIVAISCSVGFYLFFSVALDVSLPTGVLGF